MSSASSSSSRNKPSKLDFNMLMRVVLAYEDHFRLMLVLFSLGILGGMCYFVFARATYESTCLVRVNQFLDTAKAAEGGRGTSVGVVRALTQQLTNGYLLLQAGQKIGMIGPGTSYSDMRAGLLPALRINALDQNHLQMRVVSFKPRMVREFPQALIESYEETRVRLRAEFREKAIQRYLDELKIVRERVMESLDARLKFEEESALATAQIELERLSNVPVLIAQAQHKLEEIRRIEEVLKLQGDSLGLIGRLTLLTSTFDTKKDPLEAGRLVRRQTAGPVLFQTPETMSKVSTHVVVQPDMVDGLEVWRELEKKKRTLEEKLRQQKIRYLDDHPEMIKLRQELADTDAGLELELSTASSRFEVEKARLQDELETLEKKLPEYYKATKDYDEKRTGFALMDKGQLAWDKAYEKLSKQIESLEFFEDPSSVALEFRGFTDIRSETPVSPSKMKLLTFGLLLGLGLAGGVPFLLIRLRTSISDLSEFEQRFGIPGIGLVPLSDPKILESVNRSPAIDAKVPNSLLENFRLIRSSILLNRSPLGEPRVIMLTSARPAEGKTTVSANVAWAFASMGEKTLLIDCDLRRGRVHSVAGIPNLPGLTRLLTGQAGLEECIVKSPADNLWILPRGPVLAGTTELLNTQVFSKILDQLRGKFSKIILDTPPVLGLSETAFLQNHAEGVVLVVDSMKTNRKDVDDAFNALHQLNAHFYGFVLNRVDFSKRANYYNYYYYSSNYYDSNWQEEEEERAAKPDNAAPSQSRRALAG